MTDAVAHECTKPPLVLTGLDPGTIYHVAAALKDADGYLSQWSQHLSIEKPIGNTIILVWLYFSSINTNKESLVWGSYMVGGWKQWMECWSEGDI